MGSIAFNSSASIERSFPSHEKYALASLAFLVVFLVGCAGNDFDFLAPHLNFASSYNRTLEKDFHFADECAKNDSRFPDDYPRLIAPG